MLECTFKFILKFIFKSILQVPSCEICKIFKRTFFTEHLQTTASAVGLLIFYLQVCEHLEGVISRYCAPISTHIAYNRSFNFLWHVSDHAQNDLLVADF